MMGGCINGRAWRADLQLTGTTLDISPHLSGKAANVSARLTGRCSIICSVAELKYLNVSPSEVQWITPDKGVVYHVDSNAEWIIVIN